MAVSMADITKLRKMTGAGMMDCKNALTEAEGDFDKAMEIVVAEKNIDTNKILAKKASYDYERGKTVIGVEIYVDGFEYDVELDAMTGAVQKWN